MKQKVITSVCSFYQIPFAKLKSRTRKRAVCNPRHILVYFLRMETKMTVKEIGRMLGGRDHTTACNSVKKVNGWLEFYQDTRDEVDQIKSILQNS